MLNQYKRLYPEYDRLYGPFRRKQDGRKHVCLYKTITKDKLTISYPKLLIELITGRKLAPWETVDHIDGNFTNDRLENLQILPRLDNAKKSMIKEVIECI